MVLISTIAHSANFIDYVVSQLIDLTSLFENPKFSDYIFKCEGKTWNVHKNIVGCQSDVFEKACNGQFKVKSQSLPKFPP